MGLTRGEKIFGYINILIMLIIMFITLYPLWYVFVASFSDPMQLAMGRVTFWPSGFELASYEYVFGMNNIWIAYGNTVFYAVVGTLVSMVFTVIGAYPLSRRRLRGRKLFTLFILITMWFGAGMIPYFLNFQRLGFMDSRWGIIFTFTISTFNVILLRTFFENVPDSMEESAKIDGANDIVILARVYLPLSVPALATITLFYFVGRWNSWFWAMMLLRDQQLIPLQVLLRRIIVETQFTTSELADVSMFQVTEQTIIYATIVVSVIPMLMVFPFIKRFFVRGIMVGAIKG